MVPFLLALVINISIIGKLGGQPTPCCTRKTVGGVEYNLVNEMDTSGYNCVSNCIYEKENSPGSKFCFATGSLAVDCGDKGTGKARSIICNYLPKSDVMEHWKIDLDQRDMRNFLDQADFTKAQEVYGNGANSMKTSEITLNAPLTQAFSQGASVEQGAAKGVLNKAAAAGDTVIKVGITPPCISQYGQSPDTSGCFTDAGGSVKVDEVDVGSGSVNLRYRTLEGFSTSADAKMTGYEMFGIYKSYYGVGDYAHKFITAALTGQNEAGATISMDFSGKDADFRVESAKKGSAFWSVWMYLIWEMEDAIEDCNSGCAPSEVETCNDAPVHAWDEAWAFYTGSLEEKYGNSAGIFPYRLAETMCKVFKTCLAGKSKVNRDLEDFFLDGKAKIDQGQCSEAQTFKKDIMKSMSIPLIQGTLHSAYMIAQGDTSSKAKAEGATFAGSILPQLANCSPADATIVKNHMWMDGNMATTADGFTTVKEAFERNYACMLLTCADIGGKDDGQGGYVAGFLPCTGN